MTMLTTRLLLRPLTDDDDEFYCSLYTDPQVMQHVAPALSAETASINFEKALRGASQSPPLRHRWVLVERDSDDSVGLVGLDYEDLRAEVGALLLLPHQGRGYAAEAIAALTEVAFLKFGLTLLHTRHARINGGAAGLMRKLGFAPAIPTDEKETECRWQLTAQQWCDSPYRSALPNQGEQLQSPPVPVSCGCVSGDKN